jgi:hypothetical protein
MARSRKTRKVVEPEAAPEEVPVVPPAPEKKVKPVKNTFTAVLQDAATYEIGGIVFKRDVPKEVDRKLLQTFKDNGWFRVAE